jgi:hypothetical protein
LRIEDADAFTDRADALQWLWDSLGRTYLMMGKYDEMVRAYQKGAETGEYGKGNISQVLNLAHAQLEFGRAEDVLKTLATFNAQNRSKSEYGEMVLRSARACANAASGRREDAAEDLAFAKAHEKTAPGTLTAILICLGKEDEAAASLIRRLGDPVQRPAVLRALSDFDNPPVKLSSYPTKQNWDAIKARADVKAAVARYGGTRRFNVQDAEF